MQFHREVLPNGLTIVGETNPSARSVALGFWVRTGARDETPDVSGVTHFLEHMIFKGSERRDAFAVNRDLDRIGASPNAFTSEENTVFHASVLPEYLPQAVDVLSDILRPSLRVEDFDMEKKVIIEEIGKYEDQPGWLAFDHARRLFFGGHRLGNSVLGTVDSVGALTRDQMHAYFRRRYVAPNITVAVAGAFAWPELVALVKKHCGGWESGPIGREQINEVEGTGRFEVETRDSSAQEHVILVAPGPTADSPLRHASSLLSVAVGDDTGSRLYWALVDPGLAESAGCGLDGNEGAGAYYTSFSGEPDQAEENLGIVQGVLEDVQKQGISAEELQQAKTKVQSHLVRASERSYRRMLDVGSAWTYLRQYRSVDDEMRDFDAVTLLKVREVLDRYPLTRVTTLALGPLQKLRRPTS
ncbi:MAG TPA: pitrilysin family protein [Gemmataceae bacterium]|nr:pitrilysin family protein [Gemmataceae bacterium]